MRSKLSSAHTRTSTGVDGVTSFTHIHTRTHDRLGALGARVYGAAQGRPGKVAANGKRRGGRSAHVSSPSIFMQVCIYARARNEGCGGSWQLSWPCLGADKRHVTAVDPGDPVKRSHGQLAGSLKRDRRDESQPVIARLSSLCCFCWDAPLANDSPEGEVCEVWRL